MNFMFYGLIISASISYLLDDIECEMDCLSSSEGVINEYTFLMVYCLLSHSVYTFLVFYIRYTCSIHSVMDRIISDLFSLHLLQHCVMTSKLQLIWPCTECGSEVEIVWQLHEPKQQPQQPRLTVLIYSFHSFISLYIHITCFNFDVVHFESATIFCIRFGLNQHRLDISFIRFDLVRIESYSRSNSIQLNRSVFIHTIQE